jgi:excisionase family DNA binding protein
LSTEFAPEHCPDDLALCRNTLMTLEEAARFLRIGRGALRRAIRRGQIPTVQRGDKVFVSRRRLLALLATPNGPSIRDPHGGRP